MSRTSRPKREGPDVYETPGWAVTAIKPYLASRLPGIDGKGTPRTYSVLEPGAASGNVIRALRASAESVGGVVIPPFNMDVTAVDIRYECADPLNEVCDRVILCDFLKTHEEVLEASPGGAGFDLIIGNPPYSRAREFIEVGSHMLNETGILVYLLRLNFLAPKCRSSLFRSNYPDILILNRRPSFTNGGSDGCEYAWFVFGKPGLTPGTGGRYTILDCPTTRYPGLKVRPCSGVG